MGSQKSEGGTLVNVSHRREELEGKGEHWSICVVGMMRQKHNEGSLAMMSQTSDGGALVIMSEEREGVHWSRRDIELRNQQSEVGAVAVTNQKSEGHTGHGASYD